MNAPTLNIADAIAAAVAAPDPQLDLIPETAPFDAEQRQWLNGLLTGLSAIAAGANTSEAPLTAMRVLYGSQSGNCEALSKDLRKFAEGQGFAADVSALDDVNPADLVEMRHLVIVVATFGEGEPTDNAAKFYTALMAQDAPQLPATLQYAVCGLGDTSYADFNKCAADIDARLAELGATRVAELVKCDVDFDEDYAAWKAAVFETPAFAEAAAAGAPAPGFADEPEAMFDKNRPFMASLMACERLSGPDSAKSVNHIEISLAGGGPDLDYAAGDALGVWPVNCPQEVQAILDAASLTGARDSDAENRPSPVARGADHAAGHSNGDAVN